MVYQTVGWIDLSSSSWLFDCWKPIPLIKSPSSVGTPQDEWWVHLEETLGYDGPQRWNEADSLWLLQHLGLQLDLEEECIRGQLFLQLQLCVRVNIWKWTSLVEWSSYKEYQKSSRSHYLNHLGKKKFSHNISHISIISTDIVTKAGKVIVVNHTKNEIIR